MAERNAVVPVTQRTTKSESKVVSPKTLEIVPVREEVHDPAAEGLTAEVPSKGTAAKTKELVETGSASDEHSFRLAQRNAPRTASSLIENLRKFADERPLHFVAAIAGVAFVAGVVLRIWRSSYE
jgi:hypothetical protein